MVRYAYVIELDRCTGCRACVMACKIENNTPQGIFWMYSFRFEEGKYPNVKYTFMPRPCMHCDNPPCVKVCPVGARFKREDGIVLTDFDRCIGCRYCMTSCPYGVNYFNWKKPEDNQYYNWAASDIQEDVRGVIPPYKNPDHEKLHGEEKRRTSGGGHRLGVMEKCTFCVHLVEKGQRPACVTTCPVNVLHFGDLDDPKSEVSNLLSKNKWFRLLEEQGTEPRVFYIGSPPSGNARPIESLKTEFIREKLEAKTK